jgi:hypothetical protein
MALSKQEIQDAKNQLLQQIQHLPEKQKKQAIIEINKLSPEAISEMVSQQVKPQKIFRKIISQEIPSVKIKESPEAIAVLSVKSISKGHTLIIPKIPAIKKENISEKIFKFSEEISNLLIEKLKAKEIRLETQELFGEIVINLIPIYDSNLTIESPSTDKTIDELKAVKKEIERIIEKKEIKKEKIETPEKKVLKLNRRIP